MQDRVTMALRGVRQRAWWVRLTGACVVAVALAACGSSSSNGSSGGGAVSTSSTASTAAVTTGASGASGDAACLAQAQKVVAAAEAPMTVKAPTQSIDMAKLKGKTVYFIGVGSGISLRQANDFAAAAKAAGLNPVLVSGATPDAWTTSIQQAIARHAAGIMMDPLQPQLIQQALSQAKAAGIPVVNENSVPPPATGVTSNVLVPTDTGAQVAAYAALQTGCKVHALISYDPSFVGLVSIGNSMKAELQKLCPSTCTSQTLSVSLATVATNAGPALQSALQRNPSINAVMPTFDSLGLLMAPAIAQSQSKAKLYGLDGDTPNLALVRQGQQAVDYSYSPTQYQAYIDLDTLARTMLHQPASPPAVQFQLFTKANLPSSDSFNAMWPKLVGYQQTYMKLWGLQ
jgi:ribose transport system substrate-binding protein